jgi:type II secretory pathway predicted ATPase ExeA
MASAENPFLDIVHKGDEKVILNESSKKKISSLSKELAKKHNIIFVVGEFGSGKSLIVSQIEKSLPKKFEKVKLVFSMELINELRSFPSDKIVKKKLVVFIDRFELSDAIDDKKLKRMLKVIYDTSMAGVGYVITCTPATIARIFSLFDEIKSRSKVYNVPPLTLEQTKKLIIERLNKVRKKKSNSIEPFTTSQIKHIWGASKGNPRMILLLCASLYEILKKR